MDFAKTGGISFEFFPPQNDQGEQNLWQSINELAPLNPNFVSVTYGAGGTTRDRTLRITKRIKNETSLFPVAHLTCVGASRSELVSVIQTLLADGVTALMALRGDPPKDSDGSWVSHPSGFSYAVELVQLAKELGMAHIGVAAFPDKHPQSPSKDFDIEILKAKQDAGAEFAVTQLFFNTDSYFELLDNAKSAGVTMPIIPGIMPLTDIAQLMKFSKLAGAPMPDQVRNYFEASANNADEVKRKGVEFATEFAKELLLGGAPGIHLYTMNRSMAVKEVSQNLMT